MSTWKVFINLKVKSILCLLTVSKEEASAPSAERDVKRFTSKN